MRTDPTGHTTVTKTAILVGAGATLAEALSGRPARKERPPLDASFFALCKLRWLHAQPLARYLNKEYGIDPFGGYRMEEIFNLVYSDAVGADPPPGSSDAFLSLIQMYRDAIAGTTNGLRGTSRGGVGALVRHLLSVDSSRELTFITFNQDVLIEKALDATARTKKYSALRWNIDTTYGMDFKSSATMRPYAPFQRLGPTVPSTPILKLHGSLNWLFKVRSRKSALNSLRTPHGDLFCVVSAGIPPWTSRHVGGKRPVPLLPLIVPPVYDKSSHAQERLQPIWAAAHEALTVADEIIVFGYSFPDTDIAARNALRRAFHLNTKVEHVHIIDVSYESAARIGSIVGAAATSTYHDVATFVRLYRGRS